MMSNAMRGVTARLQSLLVSASPGSTGLRGSERAGHVTGLVMARGCELVPAKERCVVVVMVGQKVLGVGDLLSQAERFSFSCFSESNILYLHDRFLVKFG